jgi:hypothetical protein
MYFVPDPSATQKSAVVISKAFVPSEKVNVVLYFHGYRAPAIEEYMKSREFPRIIDASGKGFIFIAPQLGQQSQFPFAGASAVDYVNRMIATLTQQGPFRSVPSIERLVLAAHSGGGGPMLGATGWFKSAFPVVETWCLDCLYWAGDPVGAPNAKGDDLYEPDFRSIDSGKKDEHDKPIFVSVPVPATHTLEQWRARVRGSVEEQWYLLSKGGLSVKVFWGNGGTLTRTANLDLLDHLDQTSTNLDLRPEFYTCPTPEKPVLIKPKPQPRSQHDPLPQTVLGECIRDCRFL